MKKRPPGSGLRRPGVTIRAIQNFARAAETGSMRPGADWLHRPKIPVPTRKRAGCTGQGHRHPPAGLRRGPALCLDR